MANYKCLRRFYLIVEKLREEKKPSFNSIKKHLIENDVEISPRTLQRDIAQIRADFRVDIIYDKAIGGYYIDETTSINVPGFYSFLELTLTNGLIEEHLKEKNDLLNYIQFESVETTKGHENMKFVLQGILLKRWLHFDYTRYAEEGVKHHEIIPCLLKRYQSRWYAMGKLANGRTATFGLDRMSATKLLTKSFKEAEVSIPDSLSSVVGLNYTGKPTTVVLEAIPLQAKYLKSLPLHTSQTILKETKQGTLFQYELIPNFELVQAILRLGSQVKVVEPETLKQEVIRSLKEAMERYKN